MPFNLGQIICWFARTVPVSVCAFVVLRGRVRGQDEMRPAESGGGRGFAFYHEPLFLRLVLRSDCFESNRKWEIRKQVKLL